MQEGSHCALHETLGVFEINLENVTNLSVWPPLHDLVLCRKHPTPVKIANRKGLTHSPAVKVICVEIHDVAGFLLSVVIFEVRVVRLAESPALH